MPEFRRTLFDLGVGLDVNTGAINSIVVLREKIPRILVEAAHFLTDSSILLPFLAAAADPGSDPGPSDFSNDAFWRDMGDSHQSYVETGKNGEFQPDESGAGDASTGFPGIEVIAAALRFLAGNPAQGLLVAGHTDRAGSEAHNEELSGARARCTAALVEGDRAGYVAAAKAHDTAESNGQMLRFAFQLRQWPCDPADPGKPSQPEIKAFQQRYNLDFGKTIAEDGTVGDETRGAFFDLFDAALAVRAGGKSNLALLRGGVNFVDAAQKTLACGERFPLERADEDGRASQVNRRVELLFFPLDRKPDLKDKQAAERIYKGTEFSLARLDPATLQAVETGSGADGSGELALEDAPAPEDGAGEMNGPLATDMNKLQDAPDLADQYAFLEPFDSAFPEFGTQAIADVPPAGNDTALA